MKYTINKTVNIDKNEITSIKAVENDMKTRFVNFQLLANNQPLDLTNLTVRVYGKTAKGTEVFNDLNIIDSTKGLVELELTRPFLIQGITEYQLKIYTSDNGVLSSNILQIDITKDLMSDNSIEASNEYNAIEKAFNQVDDSINRVNTTIEDVENKTNQTITDLTNKVNEAIEKTKPQELAEEILDSTISYIIPKFNDCNSFTLPNKYFTWNTDLGEFENTPLGNLSESSEVIFEVINYGNNSGMQQEFRQIYPTTESRKWIRNYTLDSNGQWSEWEYIGSVQKDINKLTSQIASNSSSINDLYSWVNKNIGMEYISGATSLTLQPNKAYYLDGQHVADITYIDHSTLESGEKVYFYVASGDQLAHIVFRRTGLCNDTCKVWLPKGQDFWITGNDNGDTIFTLMKIGDSMRFLS